jgi:hypothetical protein
MFGPLMVHPVFYQINSTLAIKMHNSKFTQQTKINNQNSQP